MNANRIFRSLGAALLLGVFAPAAFAQSSEDYNRFEVAAGYSHARAASTFESETADIPGEGSFTTRYCTQEGRGAFGQDFQRFFGIVIH